MGIFVTPLTLEKANYLVTKWHRHHNPVQGARFAIGVRDDEPPYKLHGAVIVGRPVSASTDPDTVAEVTRLVTDGTKNACSILYAAAARACAAMGFESIQTFTLVAEPGTSLKAAGWKAAGIVTSTSWNRPRAGRLRLTEDLGPKRKWIKILRTKTVEHSPSESLQLRIPVISPGDHGPTHCRTNFTPHPNKSSVYG